MKLTEILASKFAGLALAGLAREFPHKLDHVFYTQADARLPRELHPAFYGCYDWHSAVHSHWLLVRLLKQFPALPEAAAGYQLLTENFTAEKLAAETAYAVAPERNGFERPYGWAWVFKLTEELSDWQYQHASDWHANIRPLARHFAAQLSNWLPHQRYPIRSGVHANTAFALGFTLDYARSCKDQALEQEIVAAARRFFLHDRDAPLHCEPSGNDFLSPALVEADLMRRVLSPPEFNGWLDAWMPGLAEETHGKLLEPAQVTDRSDGQGVHLDGLNLSRAWCLYPLANIRNDGGLKKLADAHLTAGLRHVESGDFLGEHWLATFALYALSAQA